MSGAGRPDLSDLSEMSGADATGEKDVKGAKVAVVAAAWHREVMDGLIGGTQRALADAGITDHRLVRVPGSFELPVVAQAHARAGYDVVIALGVIIRGGTPHFEYVASATTDGLARVALDTGVPIGFGLLTCDDERQALDRAGLPGSAEDKGREATEAALATWMVLTAVD